MPWDIPSTNSRVSVARARYSCRLLASSLIRLELVQRCTFSTWALALETCPFWRRNFVGPEGRVVGVDRAEAAVAWAMARVRSQRIKQVDFLLGDPAAMQFSQQFDAIVGRFVLMYYPDPVAAIRNLSRHLRPNGLMVFQEFDMDYLGAYPTAPTFDRAAKWMRAAFRATGARIRLGAELYPIFLSAGLPGPSLRMDILIGGGAEFQGYDLLAGVLQSLFPVMEQLGIATAADIDFATLAERMRGEVVATNGVALSPAIIGAWCRKSNSS